MRFRAETGVSPDVARLRRNAEVKGLHHPEGVVHHDGDVEGRAPAAVALGLRVREARAEEADEVDGADPAAECMRESLLSSCDRATARVNGRLCLVDVEDRAGESG